MRKFTGITRVLDNKQELFPSFSEDFPYIATLARIDKRPGGIVPWHWHDAVELFYMESGCLEYETPGQTVRFPAGSGGFVNAGILHSTRAKNDGEETTQLLHIFEPSFIAGQINGVIFKRYIQPVISRTGLEILPVFPNTPTEIEWLTLMRSSFELNEDEPGYEMKLRNVLSELWMRMLSLVPAGKQLELDPRRDRIREIMRFVQSHYMERISVAELAAFATVSERECYRLFHECLHCAPMEFIISYRLDMAGRMLLHSNKSMTEISQACGFGSSSYFGKVFLERFGCTPSQYRKTWQDREKISQK